MKTLELSGPHDIPRNSRQWLNLWKHGHMLENAYWRPVIFLSKSHRDGNFTILPDFHPFRDVVPLVLAHVNDCHWMLVRFPSSAPYSPYPPVMMSRYFQDQTEGHDHSEGWMEGLKMHFICGKMVFSQML